MSTTEPAVSTEAHPRATFRSFEESTAEDWAIITPQLNVTQSFVADRVISLLRDLDADHGGFPVSRLEHSLQTATRAERAGKDDEYVFCALVHDVGDTLSPFNHEDVAAAIVKPFVSDANYFMVKQHGIFQGYYFWHHVGADPDTREKFRGHEFFDYTAEFCAEFDQTAFDASYVSNPLEHYEPLVRDILKGA